MLRNVIYEGRKLNLAGPRKVGHESNTYTIIIGKNGTGKSRLLSAIVSEMLYRLIPNERQLSLTSPIQDISFDRVPIPGKIIAVSTSPFDKFPLQRNRNPIPNYTYLGLRELSTNNFGLGYLSKIIGSLIEVIIHQPAQLEGILEVLRYLDYTDHIQIQLQVRASESLVKDMLSTKQFLAHLERFPKGPKIPFSAFNWEQFRNEDGTISKRKVDQLAKIVKRNLEHIKDFRSLKTLSISRNGIMISERNLFSEQKDPNFLADLPFLLQVGLVRLRKVILSKRSSRETFSISDASSGEQSVLMNILGIASQISNNSLICIDEPEVCLHPEWQERYIKLLVSTFQKYVGCHFLIATHSPQIVSNLDAKNSFILSMETGKTIEAKTIIGHSSDFQLANVFDSPGFKNEYLARIAISVFTKVTKNKTFDSSDKQYFDILAKNSKFLEASDPVLDLYSAINEMHKLYG